MAWMAVGVRSPKPLAGRSATSLAALAASSPHRRSRAPRPTRSPSRPLTWSQAEGPSFESLSSHGGRARRRTSWSCRLELAVRREGAFPERRATPSGPRSSQESVLGRLTPGERRRKFLAQQQARAEMLTRLHSAPIAAERRAPRRGPGRLLKTAVIVTLLGGGWFAYHAVEFHVPLSLVEALLPRLSRGAPVIQRRALPGRKT